MPIHCPVFVRRAPCHLLEPAVEMQGIGKSQFVGYLADGFRGVESPFFRHVKHLLPDVFQSGHSGLLLHEVAEIVSQEVKRVGTVLHRRHPSFGGPARCEYERQTPYADYRSSVQNGKKQCAGLHAQGMARRGFVTLAFLCVLSGESGDIPRHTFGGRF